MTSHRVTGDLDYHAYTIEAESLEEESGLRFQYARKICDDEFCVTVIAFSEDTVDYIVKHVGL
ncbi:MAG: hypothetical protein AAF699_16685 [Pseudomonadota bacterium]